MGNYLKLITCKNMTNYKFIKTAKALIEISDYVSFDIFDTLLLRPYLEPTDLFEQLEITYNIPNFKKLRIEAERKARKKNFKYEEITYDDIYKNLNFPWSDSMKQKELDLESKVLTLNQQTFELYKFATKLNKKIIITSDMYLPKYFISKILSKNGIDNIFQIYISSDIKKTKFTGSLFDYIINNLSIKNSPNLLLHLGDNKISDYLIPKSKGINALLYTKASTSFINTNHRAKAFFYNNKIQHLTKSVLLGCLSINFINNNRSLTNYWKLIGYSYAAPLALSYLFFIINTAKKHDFENILFAARDGFILSRIYPKLGYNLNSTYLYAPRSFSILKSLCSPLSISSEIDYSYILKYLASQNRDIQRIITKNDTFASNIDFITNNIDIITNAAKTEMIKIENYFRKIIHENRLLFVDTATENFSGQHLLSEILGKEIYGCYFKINNYLKSSHYKYSTFIDQNHPEISNWNFIEFLLSSPEPPIISIDSNGSPIYSNINLEYEKKRIKIFNSITDGVDMFISDIIKYDINKCHKYAFDIESIISWLNIFSNIYNSNDYKNMKETLFPEDSLNTEYQPLFCTDRLNGKLSYKKYIKQINNIRWLSKKQMLIAILLLPIRFKFKGVRKIIINLFPLLKKNYFSVNITIFSRFNYSFVIGKI